MVEEFNQDRKPKLSILERHERFGAYGARPLDFVDPDRASLKDIVQTQYYEIRSIDTDRLVKLAELGREGDRQIGSGVNILDLGGGKGLLAKLIADKLQEKGDSGMVIDLDSSKKILEKAKAFYGNTPGLQFVISDSEKDAANTFKTKFNLVIVSWAHALNDDGADYSETIKKLSPPFFVNIGEEGKDFTGKFKSGGEYSKIGEWHSPLTQEVSTGHTPHFYSDKEESVIKKFGSNLFEVYARKGISGEQLAELKNSLKALKSDKQYSWEEELRELYPADFGFETDPAAFWRA